MKPSLSGTLKCIFICACLIVFSCSREKVASVDPVEVEAASTVFRHIDIDDSRGYNYLGFPNGVIRSQKDLDTFIEMVKPRPRAPGIETFTSALRGETIDFPREVLFLFRLTHTAGRTEVVYGPTTLSIKPDTPMGRQLTFRLVTKHPEPEDPVPRPSAMAEDVFPVIVDSSAVDTVSLETYGVKVYFADLTKPTPPIEVRPRR